MRIGKMRERITVETFTISQDDYGEEIKTWSVGACLWAEVRHAGANERFQGQSDRESATVQYRIKIRWCDPVTYTARVIWRNRVLDIVSITDPDGRRVEMVLGCNEHESE